MRLVILIPLLCVILSCTGRPKANAPLVLQKSIHTYETKKVTEFTLAKSDPVTGDSWTARFGTQKPGDDTQWRILGAPAGNVLLDVQADGIFIQHLLDLLLTTKVEEWAGFGPLQSFGLQTPAFSLRWSDASRSYELNIGDRVTGSAGARFAYLPGYPDQVFKVDGSGVRMLEMISSFEVLRQKRLVSYTADDIDEFEVTKKEGSPFYAQRQSGGWANRKQIKLPEAVRDWVEMLTHVRIQKFEDTPALARSLAEVIVKSPDLQITLKDRDAIPLKLHFKEINGREWAISSDRQGALFELYPGIIQRLRQTKF